MEKGDKITELFYRASLRVSFQNEIKKFRKKFNIPEGGFTNRIKEREWREKMKNIQIMYARGEKIDEKDAKFVKFYLEINKILEHFEMPPPNFNCSYCNYRKAAKQHE